MDIHRRVMAILHIIHGLLVVGGVLIVGLIFGVFFGVARESPGLFAGLGAALTIPFLLFGLGQIGAAFAYLKGHTAARTLLIVFSVLGMWSFPIGTALGVYSLWVLLMHAPGNVRR